ncbi:glycosyltransferase family 2 protein [Salinibacter ruber]|uniref:glycosyltransferase family 2 protein n=1 Tax=Salinibacter ruber TaxID=146919 RepID=UPI002168BC1E|nr:glycosyltransferase involved in cell wall biosynthesis [Salinibacter ruber]
MQPTGESWPKISVVTPSYNQGQFIEETIRSVLLQGYPNLEYIVVDGGSTDQTVNILEKYDSWVDYWVSEPDEGQSDAINKGFAKATGRIFAWLNSDDYYATGALFTMAEAFQAADAEVGAVVGTGHKVNGDGDIVYTPDGSDLTHEAFLNWLDGGSFMQPACFLRREAWEECGPLRADLEYAMDIDLFLKLSRQYRFERVDETISYAHKHKGAKTTGERLYWKAGVVVQLAAHGGEEAARREAMEMADELRSLRRERHSMNRHPVFKWAMRVWRYLLK